ncbi:hypothetical protein LCGC14_2622070 [marine sediment metagenome]|uniref:Uncharacterized protein n=1 Tax=marine sediment metagenome TaxID=412755 RepID=A0A0F9CDV0_9ZZZZ
MSGLLILLKLALAAYLYVILRAIWVSYKKTKLRSEHPDFKYKFVDKSEILFNKFWVWDFEQFYERDYVRELEEDEEEMRPWD